LARWLIYIEELGKTKKNAQHLEKCPVHRKVRHTSKKEATLEKMGNA